MSKDSRSPGGIPRLPVKCRWMLRGGMLAVLLLACWLIPAAAAGAAEGGEAECASAPNPIVCENELPGTPRSVWEVNGVGSESIEGFATAMSVNVGATERFKIKTNASAYHIDILRLGYYQGDGARMIASNIPISARLPQKQPECMKYSSTGLIDCGNWELSASWSVPSTAVSGVYIALLEEGNGHASQIPFVVRNESSHSEIILQTSDATWEAYNDWGGNSLYTCTVSCPPGEPEGYKAAYAVSYNRPWEGSFEVDGGASYLWYAEYQMIYWLEKEGYNVSYTSESSIAEDGAQLLNHKLFISSGHDEYWSASQRAHVEEALKAGVNLAFFSGNEIFWKTRWAPSTEGVEVPNRTLITYKETHFNEPVDPEDPPEWTGSWADPRFSPPANGGLPANALTGQQFMINAGTANLTVPYQYSKLRMWRHTAAAGLEPGHSLTLAPDTLGYEWDEDVANGLRPAGELDLSATTVTGLQAFIDYGTVVKEGATATHHLTLYRAPSGALVFGAGTVQWSWGLANINAWESETTQPSGSPPDPTMEQATVNLFAEMGAQPGSLSSGLVAVAQSADHTPPTSAIASPDAGASIQDGSRVTLTGTATDSGGGVVAGVEVSTDGGKTWYPATLTTPAEQSVGWSYTWVAHGYPSTTIESRAVDDSANLETPSDGITAHIVCPCSIWGAGATPPTPDSGDPSSLELGVKFTSEEFGTVTGVQFYKSAKNTGTHVGSLWTAEGKLLAQATFKNESSEGWQRVTFSEPVAIEAGKTYVVSYLAPEGHYAQTPYYFYSPPATGGNVLNSPPLHAVPATSAGSNGLYAYTASPTFPASTFHATNYWVDPVFEPAAIPSQVTNVSAVPEAAGATVSWSAPSSGVVSKYTITPYIGPTAQEPTVVSGSPPSVSATVLGLTPGATYTFTVQASNPNGSGPVSAPSNPVTPPAVAPPSPPRSVSASPATKQALVAWQAPDLEGGSPITGYTVTPYVGSEAQEAVNVGPEARGTTVKGLANGTAYTFQVTATNEVGTSEPSQPTHAITPEDTIFDFATPALIDSGDSNAVELGVKFTTSREGSVTGIRFYKATENTGTHVGSLWTAEGKLLAEATFTHETESGWQQVAFSEPVAIEPGKTYVAAYFAAHGHYSATSEAFRFAGVANKPLEALSNEVSADGVYAYSSSSTFPAKTFDSINYWVDVLFAPVPPSGPPQSPTGVVAVAASHAVKVSWSPPEEEGGGPITGYTVTAYIGSEAQEAVSVGAEARNATITGLPNGTTYTFQVTATNELGTSEASKTSDAVAPENTLFEFDEPPVIDSGDGHSVELGLKFSPQSNGSITGIRFYKAAANTGTHIGSLWTLEGKLLASAKLTAESASGWQQVSFAEPVAVKAGHTYLAGYFAPDGHYSVTSSAFSSAGLENAPLLALSNAASTNGVYAYSSTSTFPAESFDATDYWVDVLFAPGAASPPEAPEGVRAAPASRQALVSWNAPNDGGSHLTGYTVSAYAGSEAKQTVHAGAEAGSAIVEGLSNGTAYTFRVAATNEAGTGEPSAQSNAITPEDTIFDFSAPASADSGDGSSIELGVKFTSEVPGTLTGIRFYKAPHNGGTHIGSLWSPEGTLLASATFEGETAEGWQQVLFSEPVAIEAGKTYVASYFAPQGHYSATAAAFAAGGVTNTPLQALSNEVSPDGVYAYSLQSTFPSATYNATNYWVDVLFAPGP